MAALPQIGHGCRKTACRANDEGSRLRPSVATRLPEEVEKKVLACNRPEIHVAGAPFCNAAIALDCVDECAVALVRGQGRAHVIAASRSPVRVTTSRPSRCAA